MPASAAIDGFTPPDHREAGMDYDVIRGDIAQQSADALVCAAATSLLMDTGSSAQALLHEGGEELGEAALQKGPIELGEVAVTDAYDLDSEHVIHAAAAHFGGEAHAEHVRSATRSALERADDLGCESLVMPALGCGVAGFDVEEGADIIFAEIEDFDPETLRDVRVIGYTSHEHDQLRAVAERRGH